LTANALKGDRERFLNEGLDEYTTKPLVINEIISILDRLIGGKARTIESAEESVVDDEVVESTQDEAISLDLEDNEAQIKENNDKILLLKENALEQKIFVRIIENLGFNVEAVDTFDTLVEKAGNSSDPYKLIFADRLVEGLDIGRLEKINKITPVILLIPSSGYETDEKERNAVTEIIKNFINKELLKVVIQNNSRG
jgi:CheY-like chemotaxis protein